MRVKLLCPIFRLGNIANGKLQPFLSLNQSKHYCYTLSTTGTLFKLASEVGPRIKNSQITKTKSFIPPLPTIIYYYIFICLVTIHPFLQEIWCKKVIFQKPLTSCDLDNRDKVIKTYSALFYLQMIHMSIFGLHEIY